MISTLKAYNVTATDSASIVDKFNEVGKLISQLVHKVPKGTSRKQPLLLL